MRSRNKRRKIRRRSNVFSRNTRRKDILKVIGLAVLAAAIVFSGFFAAKFINEGSLPVSDPSSESSMTNSDTTRQPTKTTETKPKGSDNTKSLRAFYLPVLNLETNDSLFDDAADAGFNAVVFDLKSEDGILYYQSTTELSEKSKAIADNALTLNQLSSLKKQLQDKGFTPIPRLYAFRDPISPSNIPSAKILLKDYPGYTWLDNSREKGGKPWLNPYAPDAHSYIIGLAEELSGIGFSKIILDGVQFPNQTSRAYYGESDLISLSKQEVLKKFINDIKTAVGSNCEIIHSMPGLPVFKDGTEPFGGNPVTLGADVIAPQLLPSMLGKSLKAGETTLGDPSSNPSDAVELAAGQVKLRLELIDETQRPSVMPWLQAFDYTAEQINGQISATTKILGNNAPYILYNPDGVYDFKEIKQR
ncbi:MAG: putative glycoside hydrolase [Oscillospiraceae bacterium]|nr:putative glycoside hydrolase [Oscillospiraceae bacterium]